MLVSLLLAIIQYLELMHLSTQRPTNMHVIFVEQLCTGITIAFLHVCL